MYLYENIKIDDLTQVVFSYEIYEMNLWQVP